MQRQVIESRYRELTASSACAFSEAKRWLPGGCSRQAGFWHPYPLTFARGETCYLWDLDGRRYIDLLGNYTALVHGHAYPPIVAAARARTDDSSCWVGNNEEQVRLAQLLVERVGSVEQVRFTNSGTEAANLALMIARRWTGRDKVLMARGGYHGSLMEFEAGFGGATGPLTCIAQYGDLPAFQEVLSQEGESIAAVFLEPVMGAGGVISGSQEFIEGVREAAHSAGALFVLDEVLTLRLARGGRQAQLGVTPDLTLFGKLIGGGFPVGAVGGGRELLELFDPANPRIFHTGTFNANPVTMAAGVASVEALTAERIDHMDALAEKLKTELLQAASQVGLALSINHTGSIMNLFFSDSPGTAYGARDDQELMARFHLAALNHGLFLAPRGLIALSTVMSGAIIDEVLERAVAALADTAAAEL